MMTLSVLFSGLLAFAPPSLAAPSKPAVDQQLQVRFPVEKYKLENGLTVLLVEDHTVPMISYHTWYKVGSRDERPGLTGAAHMLEHMMFQGSKKYTGKQVQRLMDENGIDWNAFTSNDMTGFYMNLPSSKLELVMDIEVDRMGELTLDAKNLASEREVVKEERRLRVDNSPFGQLRELMMSTMFRVSNYRWPVIGTMKDIGNYKASDLRDFHHKFYVPSNAVLTVVGDFNSSRVKSLIEKKYGSLSSRPAPERKYPKEPAQVVQYNAVIRRNVQATSFIVAYQGVPATHPDAHALDLAATVLGRGASSRLNQRLVYQKESASSAWASFSPLMGAGVFSIGVTMKPDQPMDEALEVVYNEIYKLRNRPIPAAELRKAKTIVMKGFVDDLTTLDGKARALTSNEIATGSYESLFGDLEKYEAVTADDIRRTANALFNQTQRSIVVLEPQATASPQQPEVTQ